MSDSGTKRISLWSGPRNVSTALMYSFAQRLDTQVFDEPLYAHYLTNQKNRPQHPDEDAILQAQNSKGQQVVKEVLLGDHGKPVLFFKNMAHHLVGLEWGFLGSLDNVLLTREPRDMLHSYSQTIPEFGISDTGYDKLKKLADVIVGAGRTPIVIDSKKLLQDPEKVLKTLCDRLEIPFDPRMLSWEAGPKPEDGVWATHWYGNVHRSTEFAPYRPKTEPFPERLKPLLGECQKLYDELLPWAIG